MIACKKRIIAILCVVSVLFLTACGSPYSAPGSNPAVIRNIFNADGITHIDYEESSDAVMFGKKKMTAQDGEHMGYSGILTLSSDEAGWLADSYEWEEMDLNDYPFPDFKYVNATSLAGKKWYRNDVLYYYYIKSNTDWDVMFLGFDGNDTIVFWIEEKDH